VTAKTLLAVLWARGVQLEAVGERLRFRPAAAVSPDLRAALVAHKAEVLARLREAGPPPELPLDLPPPPAGPQRRSVLVCARDLWPRNLPGLGPRRSDAYTRCAGCGGPTWVYYGATPQCRRCAERAARRRLRKPAAGRRATS
jgi:hypothetical protein